MLEVLIAAFLSVAARAAVIAPPDPTITPPALLPRAVSIYGWYSGAEQEGTTVWNAATYEANSLDITSSGTAYGFCNAGISCNIWYGCSGSYMLYGSTSSLCATSSSTCSYNLLYSTDGDPSPLTGYWCNEIGYTGLSILRQTPDESVPATTPSVSSTDAPTTATSLSSTTVSPAATQTPPPQASVSPPPESNNGGGSNNTGAIVGGVVGGLAVIGAIAIGIVLLLRRNKKRTGSNINPAELQNTPMMGQTQAPASYYQPGKPNNGTAMPYDPHQTVYYQHEMPGSMPEGYGQTGAVHELPDQRR